MIPGMLQIVSRSVKFYRKPILYQILIIALLTAVITGSLMTGRSVRLSLKRTASERLGNTSVMISSGMRYFDASLDERMRDSAGIKCTGLLEMRCYCQNLSSQKGAFNTNLYAVNKDFFAFHGSDSVKIKPGYIAVNKKLADYLDVKAEDEIIIRYNSISEIPADAPFAPAKGAGTSVVMRIGAILEPYNGGNFSLSISQIMPMNIFINLSDLPDIGNNSTKINRLLISNKNAFSSDEIYRKLKHILKLSDIGFTLRTVKKTGGYELISDRVFIEKVIIDEIKTVLPGSAPIITYLGNRFSYGTRSTPYSFVSALPSSLYADVGQDDEIIINRWLADDLAAKERDTIEMYWYKPDSLNKLTESRRKFIIKQIVDMQGIWSDSLLMPDFPGISGTESCSEWDAGIQIKLIDIRRKDEDYWKKFKGTPKAFINYEKGKELWGNNFGPGTAIRFPAGISEKEIRDKLYGSIDPFKSGFSVRNLSDESEKAASESVDFSSLFLSLGFFLISASVVLLSLAVASYFNSKRGQINILFALGFQSRWIEKLLFLESGFIALVGCFIGALAGYLVNLLITLALNSVWKGAVQTDTLKTFFNFMPWIMGFLITFLTTMVFMLFKLKSYLKILNQKEKEIQVNHSKLANFAILFISSALFVALFVISILYNEQETSLSFASGTVLLIVLVLFWRQYFIGGIDFKNEKIKRRKGPSRLYYSFYPSHAITPIIFIAAGLFAVFITGSNRMNFDSRHLKRSGGTGGYLYWCENTIPVKEDLNSVTGRKASGLDDKQLMKMSFVQAKRSSGDDASCLNLNHITSPPLLGIDPADFISKGSFSFSKIVPESKGKNPWQFLNMAAGNNTVYGIADQTVLDWGLKLRPGDTLILRAENGQPLNIIIAAGLKSSVFQGYVLIGMDNFIKYYPSVSGSSVFLVDGDQEEADLYKNTLNERFENNGINTEKTTDRLASFYEVTNTYLSVFGVFGALGMVTGIAGLGFVLLRNYNHRKREFALMLATGFPFKRIRRMILSEQILILFAGVISGVIPALVATLPSLSSSPDVPWLFLSLMVTAIIVTGVSALIISVRAIKGDSLILSLKKE